MPERVAFTRRTRTVKHLDWRLDHLAACVNSAALSGAAEKVGSNCNRDRDAEFRWPSGSERGRFEPWRAHQKDQSHWSGATIERKGSQKIKEGEQNRRRFGSERGTRTPDPRIMIPVL